MTTVKTVAAVIFHIQRDCDRLQFIMRWRDGVSLKLSGMMRGGTTAADRTVAGQLLVSLRISSFRNSIKDYWRDPLEISWKVPPGIP